ncbi:MAG TPA: hypothetical protein VF884_16215 [Nitrososphaeraceae archaeon]
MSKQTQSRLFATTILSLFVFSNYNSVIQADKLSGELPVLSQTNFQEFRTSLSAIVNQSQTLTKSYQDEIGKWRTNQYDNSTTISITDSFVPKFENITNTAQNMTYPNDYKYVHDALVNSLKSETESYQHFRNYLASGNKTEDEISTDLLTNALQYEIIYSRFLSMPLPPSGQSVTISMQTYMADLNHL